MVLFLIVAWLFWTCKNIPVEVTPSLLWQKNPFGQSQIESIYPIFYKDKVIITQNLIAGGWKMVCLSKTEGNVTWTYTDTSDVQLYYNLKPFVYDSILVLPIDASAVAINLNTGNLVWKNAFGESAELFYEGYPSKAFRSYYTKDSILVMETDCLTGKLKPIYAIPKFSDLRISLRTPAPDGNNSKNIENLVFCKTLLNSTTNKSSAVLAFYNIKEQKIIKVDTLEKEGPEVRGITKQPLIDYEAQNIYIVCHEKLYCYNLIEKTLIWQIALPRDMLTSNLTFDYDAIYFPSEDGYLYKINKVNGKIIWKSKVGGTPSRVYSCDYFIHVVGGSTGKWYIIQKSTGEPKKILDSPNAKALKDIFFRRYFTMSPDGKNIIATDGKDFLMYSLLQH
jgi:outer membrane protein assembly factor BamB